MNNIAFTQYSHLNPEFTKLLDLPEKERVQTLYAERWIGYERAQNILEILHDLMARPKKARMQSLLIVGDSNNGKTTLVNHFRDQYPTVFLESDAENDAKTYKPVILAQSPTTANEKGLYMSILENFFSPYRPTDTTAKLKYQAVHLMRLCNVKLLVIDEIHNVLSGTAIKQREVMNAIKTLSNELCIPIIGVGIQDAVRVLHTDAQHASRFDVIQLPLWDLDRPFLRLLASFEKILPLKHASDLISKEKATLLHNISGGNLGDLHKLLNICAEDAIKTKAEQITLEIINKYKHIKPTKGIRELI